MKTCGSCTLCCKFTTVPELPKSGNGWCPHCEIGKGCRIYDDRPESCRAFLCFWKAEGWPDELRPDRCRVMFEALVGVNTVMAVVEPSRPQAWRKQAIARVIERLTSVGRSVLVFCGPTEKYVFLAPNKTMSDVEADVQTALRIRNGCSELHDRPQHPESG